MTPLHKNTPICSYYGTHGQMHFHQVHFVFICTMNQKKHAWHEKVIALGLAGILDLAAGTLFVFLLSKYFSHPLLSWQYILGAFLAAAPDIDLLLCLFGREPNEHHENLTHRPIVGILLAALLGGFFGGTFWALTAVIGVCWHYLHDTEGFLFLYDNGIGWLWPFSKKYWGVRNFQIVSQTLPEFLAGKKTGFGATYEDYLNPTPKSLREFTLAGIFFGYVAGGLFGPLFGVIVAGLFLLSIMLIWKLHRGA